MSTLREIFSVTGLGLRSVPSRAGSSMTIVIGVATVVAVFIAVLAVATGFEHVARGTGRRDRAVILNRDASTEASSTVARSAAQTISNAPGIAHDAAGQPILSAESLTFVPFADERSGRTVFITLRGVGPQGLALRPEVKLIKGRMFVPGAREVIVGRAANARMPNLGLGSTVQLPQGDWPIVGIFESGGDSHESELMSDVETVMTTYRRNAFNSMTVGLTNADAFAGFAASLGNNPSLTVDVMRENEYFDRSSRDIAQLLRLIAFGMGGIMTLGAAFGAVNAMYTAVSTRESEIATLRAIGFGSTGVVSSVLLESLLLALTGALAGALVAWTLFNGATISTVSGGTPAQITFPMTVNSSIVAMGVIGACAVGLIGGLLPAFRAGRSVVANALRR